MLIRADKRPPSAHVRLFNKLTINEAAVLVAVCFDILGRTGWVWNSTKASGSYLRFIYNKKVSALQFYSYRLMIRVGEQHIFKYRQLFHQYVVDMYVKVETERLFYLTQNEIIWWLYTSSRCY